MPSTVSAADIQNFDTMQSTCCKFDTFQKSSIHSLALLLQMYVMKVIILMVDYAEFVIWEHSKMKQDQMHAPFAQRVPQQLAQLQLICRNVVSTSGFLCLTLFFQPDK